MKKFYFILILIIAIGLNSGCSQLGLGDLCKCFSFCTPKKYSELEIDVPKNTIDAIDYLGIVSYHQQSSSATSKVTYYGKIYLVKLEEGGDYKIVCFMKPFYHITRKGQAGECQINTLVNLDNDKDIPYHIYLDCYDRHCDSLSLKIKYLENMSSTEFKALLKNAVDGYCSVKDVLEKYLINVMEEMSKCGEIMEEPQQ